MPRGWGILGVKARADRRWRISKLRACLENRSSRGKGVLAKWITGRACRTAIVGPLTPSLSPSEGERVPFRAGEGFRGTKR